MLKIIEKVIAGLVLIGVAITTYCKLPVLS